MLLPVPCVADAGGETQLVGQFIGRLGIEAVVPIVIDVPCEAEVADGEVTDGPTPAWLMRPGRIECGEMWPLVQRIYTTLTSMTLPDTMPSRERRTIDAVLTHHADLLASLQGWERRIDLIVLPDQADFDSLGLSGFARDALDDLQTMAEGSGPDAVRAQEAMSLLVRLTGSAS